MQREHGSAVVSVWNRIALTRRYLEGLPVPLAVPCLSQAYNPAAMNPLDRETLRITWNVATRQHEMLNQVIPAVGEIVTVFQSEKPPTREQLDRWQRIYAQLTQDMTELTAAYEAFLQLFSPLQFDA